MASLSPRTLRRAVLGLVVTGPLVLAACSSASNPTSTGSTTTTAHAASSASTTGAPATTTSGVTSSASFRCSSVPASEVSAALGGSFTGPVSQAVASVVICRYNGASGSALVQVDENFGEANFKAATSAASIENPVSVSGFGERAFTTSLGPTSSIQIQKGTTGLLVSGPATVAQVEALAAEILPKV